MVETCTWLTILNFISNAKDVCMSKFNPLEGGTFGGGQMILEEHNPLDITMVLEDQPLWRWHCSRRSEIFWRCWSWRKSFLLESLDSHPHHLSDPSISQCACRIQERITPYTYVLQEIGLHAQLLLTKYSILW